MSATDPKAKKPEDEAKKPARMTLNPTDKQYICAGLDKVREDAEKAEKTMFFDPQKVIERIDELKAHFSK